MRLECVQNAVDQARVVAGAMLGGDQPYDAVPRFWSSQYDIKLQTIGIVPGHDAEILRQAQADALAPILDPAALADPARPLKTLQTGTVAVPA